MSRRGSDFAGLSVAIVTPFDDGGKVDVDRLKEQIEFQVAAGTNCIVPCGTTGESPTLTHPEHERVISETIQTVAAGTGSNSTNEAISLSEWAAKEGADATLQVAPYYNKPSQEGFFQHYKAISEAVDVPHCIYNIPGRTGKNIEPETIARIAECALTDLTLLSGDDSLTLPLLAVGGEGVVSVVGNLVPQDMIAMVNAFRSGDVATAQKLHGQLFPLCRDLLGINSNPIPLKAAMAELGRDTGELRLPMVGLNQTELDFLRKTLAAYGLIKEGVAV